MYLNNEKIRWIDTEVKNVKSHKWLFKLLKFLLRKNITYKDIYIFYTHVYDFKENDILEIKRKSMEAILAIYQYNNGELPENII